MTKYASLPISTFIKTNILLIFTTTKYINASQFATYFGSVASVAADNITTGDAAVTVGTSSGNITLDGAGDIILDADDANVTIKDGGTTTLDIISNGATDVTFDAPGDIKIDAAGSDILFLDGGTTFGAVNNNGGELVLKSGSSPTTALTFSGANAITGQSSSASATPDTSNSNTVNGVEFSSGYANPELAYDSGDIIYVEERSPITRASDQTENVKLIIEF